MRLDPSGEQELVIGSDARRIVVSAAAGAGKTYVLVERYLRLLRERSHPDALRPDHILTITFTRKAAAEMKSRIVKRLHDAGLEHDAQIAETGPIQTIHSFCQRVLKENSLAAGLDPDCGIMADADSARLKRDIVLEVLADSYDDEPEIRALLEMLAGNQVYGTSGPQAALQRAIERALSNLRGTGITAAELERRYATPEATRETWNRALLETLDARIIPEIDPDQPLEAQLLGLYSELKIKKPAWLKKGQEDGDAAWQTSAFVRLVVAVWRQLESEMRHRGELDFTLLEQSAVDLVEKNASVRARLREQYRVVFVDEAQDLNPVQYRLLTGLGIETELMVGDAQQSIYGFRLADRQLFVDRKDSGEHASLTLTRNYRSTPGILNFVDQVFSQQWANDYVPMTASTPETTQSDNVLTLHFPDTACEGVEVWPMRQPDHQRVAELTKIVIEQTTRKDEQPIRRGDVCVLVRTGEQALATQKALGRVGIESQVIGSNERYYTRLEIRDVANALRWLCDPHDDYTALAVLRSPFVDVSADAFVILAKRRQSGPSVYEQVLEATAHPAASGLPDEDIAKLWGLRRWFDELCTHADRLSAWEVIGELFARTSFLEALARREAKEQLLANVRKLLMLAAERPEVGAREFAETVRDIQQMAHRESQASTLDDDADVVKIMTIHKSKGLEFPVVIVPETLKPDKPREQEVALDPRRGLVATCFRKQVGLTAAWLLHEEAEREREEQWRVMYVAMTRARERLCVVIHEQRSHNSIGGKLANILRVDTDFRPEGLTVREYGVGKLEP